MSERCCHSHEHASHLPDPDQAPHIDACLARSVRSDRAFRQSRGTGNPENPAISTAMRIAQMDCPAEEAMIRKKLEGMEGVYEVRFNLMQRVLTVKHDQGGLTAIVRALRSLGFEPEIGSGARFEPVETRNPVAGSGWLLGVALAIALGAELSSSLHGSTWLGLVMAVIAIALSGVSTYKKGLIAIVNRNLNINALMSIAVTGAFILGEWPEAAMVMVLFAIAESIEARSLDQARRSVERLMEVAPEVVSMLQPDGHWHDVPSDTVEQGALVRARPGERIGLDGIIVEGCSEVDQAPITGESMLVLKTSGDDVYAGSINGMAELTYRVTAAADDTMLARIIHAVHDAQARKAPVQRFIDRFAQVYTPLVCVLAIGVALVPPLLLGGAWYDWIYKALVLLVIACPCALVISTPVAVVGALGAAARLGILIKGGVYLEQGRNLKWLALDKTGTLTTGRPRQLDLQVLQPGFTAAWCQHVAASLARRSDHPVSEAIAAAAQQPDLAPPASDFVAIDHFEAVPGRGVQALIDGQRYYLGSYSWVSGVVSPHESPDDAIALAVKDFQEQGRTITVLASTTQLLALFIVADTVRDTARQAIHDLHDLGVRTVMLSGDNAATARFVGEQVGVDTVHANLLPDDKLALIEQFMQKGPTGMVGDGINDAPALARADIGFAMGVMGTDTAIETADVALMDDDLRKVSQFIRLSKATRRILIQNITAALGLKAIFLVMAILGVATMWMAVFADVGASLIVLANSLRLFRS